MPFVFKGTTVKKLNYRGTACKKHIAKGVQVWSADFNLLENTSWSKHNSGYSTCTTTTSKVSIETNSASANVTLYKQVDVTNYSKLTITCNISNVCYAWAGVGLQTSTTGTGEPVVGKRLSTSDGQILSFSDTIELDISNLTGNYYFSLFAYRGSGLNPKVEVTKAILS